MECCYKMYWEGEAGAVHGKGFKNEILGNLKKKAINKTNVMN